MFTLTIETDNAAFEHSMIDEIERITRRVMLRIAAGETSGKIMDINGNTVGRWELTR